LSLALVEVARDTKVLRRVKVHIKALQLMTRYRPSRVTFPFSVNADRAPQQKAVVGWLLDTVSDNVKRS
jgi:hypothetical protein